MKNLTILFVLLYLFFTNCSQPVRTAKEEDDGICEINIISNISNSRKVNLSDIASNIEYCMLEFDKKCLVTPDMSFYGSNEYIVTINEAAHLGVTPVCYVFERRTGKFVRQISRMGGGPGEYLNIISSFWDEEKEQICVLGSNGMYIFYNLDGTLSHQTKIFEHFAMRFVAYQDIYAAYLTNRFGDNKIRIAFFDKTGALVDSIPNNRYWKKTQTWSAWSADCWLYNFNNELYFKELYCDTLYHIKDFELYPRYLFNTGGRAVPYEIQELGRYFSSETSGIINRYEKYVNIMKILESSKHLYFTIDYRQQLYPAIYDKTADNLQIMLPVSYPMPLPNDKRIPLCGFENDLDGGLPFWPQQMISDKEMLCVFAPEELLELDVSKITDAKLKNVLNSLEHDSNPVVAIVTIKD